jgi:hypothetical protein
MSKDELENLVKKPAGGDGRGRHKIFGHIPCLDVGSDCVRTQLLRRMLAELEPALDAVQAGLDAVEARVDAGHAAAD